MRNESLLKAYTATTAIAAYSLVKFGANDGEVQLATAATDLIIGCNDRIPAAIGDRTDIVRTGIVEVVYGASVTRGQELTADASGRAIPAAPAAGSNVTVIGIAEVSGVVGDVGSMFISRSVKQG